MNIQKLMVALVGAFEKKLGPGGLDQLQSDLLCCAFEGGSNYWYRIDKEVYPEGKKDGDVKFPHINLPLLKGGALLISTGGDHPNPKTKKDLWRLDRAALEKGWLLMITDAPGHYADAVDGNFDACTGDVYLQLCLFGEVIFG
jgi:hypothetical protein